MAARASGKMATKGNLVHGKITKKNPSLPERRVYRQNKKLRKAVKNRSVTRAQAEMPEVMPPVLLDKVCDIIIYATISYR